MTEPDNPPPQTKALPCVTCGDPVRIPVEQEPGPVKHEDCPVPCEYDSVYGPTNE